MPCLVGLSRLEGPFLSARLIDDLWTLPSPTLSCEGQSHVRMAMPLSLAEIMYQAILNSFADPDPVPSSTDEEDLMSRPMWATSLSCSHDCLV
jgi:hypothetical protein